MEIRDQKLLEAVMALPNEFNAYKKVATERFEKIEKKLDDAVFVNLQNGDGQNVKVANILPKIYSDLKEVKQATEFLVDFNRVHRIFKKYKFYQTLLAVISVFAGISLWEILIAFIKATVN